MKVYNLDLLSAIFYSEVNLKELGKACMLSRHLLYRDNLSLFLLWITFSLKRSAAALLLKATHQCFSCLT